ncbi:MAG: hypothetical protein WA865_10330 [Spirulinaceae cyanobacterium]
MSIKLSSANPSPNTVKDAWDMKSLGTVNNSSFPQKSPYQADQQVKYLSLEAEIEFLMQELRTMQQK